MTAPRICIVPRVSGVGGMVSFRRRFSSHLAGLGVEVSEDPLGANLDAILVIGGTRRLGDLWRARRRGVRIVQRLNGMNWLHRVQRSSGTRHAMRAEFGNWLLSTIRSRLAHHIVYQSEFSRRWWERVYSPTRVSNTVVFNGVDLQAFSPASDHSHPEDFWRILLVEGSLMGGYELGLEAAIGLVNGLAEIMPHKKLELSIVGQVAPAVQQHWDEQTAESQALRGWSIRWEGLQPADQIAHIDRSAHLLYSSDINAACPNSVVEALACGLPVAAFDTGALSEMVTADAGCVAPYGGDPWRLEPPDVAGLVEAASAVLLDLDRYRRGARQRAEQAFSLEGMAAGYMQALLPGYAGK